VELDVAVVGPVLGVMMGVIMVVMMIVVAYVVFLGMVSVTFVATVMTLTKVLVVP